MKREWTMRFGPRAITIVNAVLLCGIFAGMIERLRLSTIKSVQRRFSALPPRINLATITVASRYGKGAKIFSALDSTAGFQKIGRGVPVVRLRSFGKSYSDPYGVVRTIVR
jgi:hypothetical protein